MGSHSQCQQRGRQLTLAGPSDTLFDAVVMLRPCKLPSGKQAVPQEHAEALLSVVAADWAYTALLGSHWPLGVNVKLVLGDQHIPALLSGRCQLRVGDGDLRNYTRVGNVTQEPVLEPGG